MARLTLYGNTETTRTWWTAWLCAELGLPFDNEPIGHDDEAKDGDAFRAVNPNGRVPALRDGDFVIWESMAVNLYLAKRYGGDLYPDSLEDEARAWQWSFWAVTRVEAPLLTLLVAGLGCEPGSGIGRYFRTHVSRWDDEELRRCREVLRPPFRVLDRTLARRTYLLGERFTVADLNVACIFSRLRQDSGIDLAALPCLTGWLRRCWSREHCPRRDRLLGELPPSRAP